jgi:uncharacterized protein YbdZ (MbtH family)
VKRSPLFTALYCLGCLGSAVAGYGLVKWIQPKAQSLPIIKPHAVLSSADDFQATAAPAEADPFLLRIQQTEPADYPTLWEELGNHPVKSSRDLWQQVLIIYWARKAPAAGNEFLEKQSVVTDMRWLLLREWWRVNPATLKQSAGQDKEVLSLSLEALASSDEVNGWKELRAMAGDTSMDSESEKFIQRLAEKDFAGTEKWCREHLGEWAMASVYPSLLEITARTDPKEAWRLACGVENPLACQEHVMRVWCQKDPEAAMAVLMEIQDDLPKPEIQSGGFMPSPPMAGLRGDAVAALFAKDPQAALRLAERLHTSHGGMEEISNGLARSLPKDPAQLAKLIQEFGGDENSSLRGYLTAAASKVAWTDPAAAAQLLSQQAIEPKGIANALAQWWKQDEISAVEFMSQQPDEVRREAWSKLDDSSLSLAKISPDAMSALLRDAAMVPPEVLSRLANLGELPLMKQYGLASDEMSFTLTEAAMKLPPGPGREEAQRQVFANQLAADPTDSQRYVTDLLTRDGQTPAQQASLAQSLGQTWATVDAQSASEFLTAQPAGPVRDHLAQGLAQALAWDDPNSAFVWAKSIGDTTARQDALQSVLTAWGDTNPASAEAAHDSLTAADIQWLREHPVEVKK